ncbi:MAG: glycoside hydrolase family 3 C-terminal domain-containing protein [Bacteroidetes bacterium]|jgi:beta-glucosidase|nr:glycoside hydrolase family 3 C-terminal domain-containing protein [Bacteroidota bacterium]
MKAWSLPAALCGAFLALSATARGQSLDERIDAIVVRMSLEEKILQLHGESNMSTADNVRLGVPGFLMDDGPHGVRNGTATSFPVGIGMAATWDPELAYRIGVAMGKEFRGKGRSMALGPALDLDRDPRNGRSPETGGEDQYLCARITTAVVQGMQSQPVLATIKHFAANHRENGRTSNNIVASRRTLEEHNGLPFRMAVQAGGAFSVMNAYNLINGEKSAENATLLTTILRDHWGFPYFVVSDWGSIWSAEKAIEAGCDLEMGSNLYGANLAYLVATGAVSVSTIDNAVRNILRTKLLSGVWGFLPPGDPADVNSQAHRWLCEEAARKSIVLLKNEGTMLPLNAGAVTNVAVIGPNAAVCRTDGSGSSWVEPAVSVSPLTGLQTLLGASKVSYLKGCDINSTDTSGFPAARTLARGADAVIFVGGLDPSQEGEGFDRVGGSIELPGKQQDLINALAAENSNVVAVMYSGGVCGLSRSIANVRSLLYAFYPGQESGTALAEILLGITNPSGRLPVTMPLNDGQLPAWNDDFTDDHGGGYRWFDQTRQIPRYAFGHGLSYSHFSYIGLTIAPSVIVPGGSALISCTITNTSSRDGDEVAQLYISDAATTHSNSVKQLKGIARVAVPAGQSVGVSFTIGSEELWYYDEFLSSFTVEPGRYRIFVGGASDDLPLQGELEVANTTAVPDLVLGSIRTVPAYPQTGQRVTFVATVRNVGAAATAASVPLKVSFRVDDALVAWSETPVGSIAPGGMIQVCATAGPNGPPEWTAAGEWTHQLSAVVDDNGRVDEGDEGNNGLGRTLSVYAAAKPNLAVWKRASATSSESTEYGPQRAVDGNMGTRWSSNFSDPQAIIMDLDSL